MNQPVRPLVNPIGNANPSNSSSSPHLKLATQPPKFSPGGFWRRFVAACIDGFVITIATMPIKMIVRYGFVVITGAQPDPKNISAVASMTVVDFLLSMVAVYYYAGYFYSKQGATPGKAVMKLKVLNHSKGTYLNYKQAFLRETVGKFLSGITLGIGYFMAAFRKDKRALHDLIADSEVVKHS